MRLVNSLNGFVEGVGIRIDPREQLQARMGRLWRQMDDIPEGDKDRFDALMKEVDEALDDVAGLTEKEREDWRAPFLAA